MGLLDRIRTVFQDRAGVPPGQRTVGPSLDDVDRLRRALTAEADRLGRSDRLALTIFLEQTDLDVAGLDLYALLHHLVATGELINFRQDSFGQAHFDLALNPPDEPGTSR